MLHHHSFPESFSEHLSALDEKKRLLLQEIKRTLLRHMDGVTAQAIRGYSHAYSHTLGPIRGLGRKLI